MDLVTVFIFQDVCQEPIAEAGEKYLVALYGRDLFIKIPTGLSVPSVRQNSSQRECEPGTFAPQPKRLLASIRIAHTATCKRGWCGEGCYRVELVEELIWFNTNKNILRPNFTTPSQIPLIYVQEGMYGSFHLTECWA